MSSSSAELFSRLRPRLMAIGYRMLGSVQEAEDLHRARQRVVKARGAEKHVRTPPQEQYALLRRLIQAITRGDFEGIRALLNAGGTGVRAGVRVQRGPHLPGTDTAQSRKAGGYQAPESFAAPGRTSLGSLIRRTASETSTAFLRTQGFLRRVSQRLRVKRLGGERSGSASVHHVHRRKPIHGSRCLVPDFA
jgi:hypothetical protein